MTRPTAPKAGERATKRRTNEGHFVPRHWQGYTYPGLLRFVPGYWLWSRLCCPRSWHLFDEVTDSASDHYLVCDACGVHFGWCGHEYEDCCLERWEAR